jgi:hypothetical protein
MEQPNMGSLASHLQELGLEEAELVRTFRTFNANAEPFRTESERHDARRRG